MGLNLHTLPKSFIFFESLIENLTDYNSFVQSEVKMIVLHSGGQSMASNRKNLSVTEKKISVCMK